MNYIKLKPKWLPKPHQAGRLLATVALAPALGLSADNSTSRLKQLSGPDCVTPANLVTQFDPAPVNQTYMRVQHIGEQATAELAMQVANRVTWNVSELTGFRPSSPDAQRGYRDVAGSSAFQLWCEAAGFYIDTWQFAHGVPLVGEGPSASIARNLSPAPQPFASGGSILLEADVAVPWIANQRTPVTDGTAQVSFFVYWQDSGSGRVFAQLVGLFDNRRAGVNGTGIENLGNDGIVAFVSSPLRASDANGNTIRFISVAESSATMQFVEPWHEPRHFAAHVTRANFVALLQALGSGSPGLSPDPEAYQLLSFGILGEVFPGTGNDDNVSLGASVSGLRLSIIRSVRLPSLRLPTLVLSQLRPNRQPINFPNE